MEPLYSASWIPQLSSSPDILCSPYSSRSAGSAQVLLVLWLGLCMLAFLCLWLWFFSWL